MAKGMNWGAANSRGAVSRQGFIRVEFEASRRRKALKSMKNRGAPKKKPVVGWLQAELAEWNRAHS